MEVRVGGSLLRVIRGDITDQQTEAIVNAANNHLWMGAGVAGAIKRKGGEEIESEAVAQGPIDIGDAVVTSAGRLKARYVIHAAAMGQDLRTDAQKIEAATRNSLRLAETRTISSVSMPALGTGVGGFSPFHCARIMIAEAISALQQSQHLREIRFVLYDKPTHDAFEEELRMQFSSARH